MSSTETARCRCRNPRFYVTDNSQGEVLVTADGAPLKLSGFAGGSEPLADGDWLGATAARGRPSLVLAILPAVTDEATAGRFYQRSRWDVIAPIRRRTAGRWRPATSSAGVRRRARTGRTPSGGGELSARRLLGTHLPAASPERRETVAGECLGCGAQFAVDVRLPLPAVLSGLRRRRARPSGHRG